MNFDLNINVQIGVTPQLTTFLTALLQSRPGTPAQLPAIEAPAPEVPAESEKPRRIRRTKADAPEVENPEPEAPTASGPVKETTPEAPAPDQIPTDPQKMAEKIRETMHRTRIRFEGEDYKNNPGENYKKYHKQLTSQFKQIAGILGYDKPSSIDTPEKLAVFISECAALIIGEDGNITSPPAPF